MVSKVEAQVNNGVAFRSNLNVLKAELLKADQRIIELQSTRKGFLDVLSLFINQPLQKYQTGKTTGKTSVTPDINRLNCNYSAPSKNCWAVR
jgi:hypothetical protein